jgi:hypothetical protein
MQSTLTLQETDPHDSFVIEPDVVLAARADHAPLDPVQEILSHLAHRPAPMISEVPAGASTPAVDTTFRAAAVDNTDPTKIPGDRSRWVKRALIAFLFAFCSAVAVETWKHQGDAVRQMVSRWAPPFVLALSPAAEKPALAEQPDSSKAAAADQAPAQPASADQPAEGAAPAVAASLAESAPPAQAPPMQAPSVQSVARDIAAMGQQIEQLKASIEQLKAGQAQMSRDLAKTSAQSQRARVAALAPRPIAAPVHKPRPAYPPAAAASTLPPLPYAAPPALPPPPLAQPALSQPLPLPQAAAQPDGEPVVRPPMPLR